MKTYKQHYDEFSQYLNGMTNNQVLNILADERKRHQEFPDDDCYHACYEAARNEAGRRGIDNDIFDAI